MVGTAIVRGVAVPIGILLLGFYVFFFAGMNGSLGPLDLATVNWIFIGFWVVAPVVGGLLGRTLGDRDLVQAAAGLGVILGTVVALFLLTAAGTASRPCAVGVEGSALGYVLGCLAVGAVAGGGMSGSLLLTARLARSDLVPAGIVAGAALNFAAGLAAYFLYYSLVTCFR